MAVCEFCVTKCDNPECELTPDSIEVSQYFYNKCVNFANDRIGRSADLYTKRGEARIKKILEDIIVGTVGEYGVYKYLKEKEIFVNKPDLTIYDVRNKSFAADLFNDDVIIHVKSQSTKSALRYGNSWLLQRRDKVTREPAPNEYFAFTQVDGRHVKLLGIVKCIDIIKYDLLEECKVPSYRHTKYALYWNNIKDKLIKKQRNRL